MRLFSVTILAAIAAPLLAAPAAPIAPVAPVSVPKGPAEANCPRTTSHYAGQGSAFRGDRVAPKNLGELPPATGYMAVYRTVNGCEVPMTVVEYRTGRKP